MDAMAVHIVMLSSLVWFITQVLKQVIPVYPPVIALLACIVLTVVDSLQILPPNLLATLGGVITPVMGAMGFHALSQPDGDKLS